MTPSGPSKIPEVLAKDEAVLLSGWIAERQAAGLDCGTDLRSACVKFLE